MFIEFFVEGGVVRFLVSEYEGNFGLFRENRDEVFFEVGRNG